MATDTTFYPGTAVPMEQAQKVLRAYWTRLGGRERARQLGPEARAAISKRAAKIRWQKAQTSGSGD